MTAPTAWLVATAREYHRSAGRLERMENEADFGGLTAEQWAIVYRAIAGELHKCSVAVSMPGIPVDLDGDARGDWGDVGKFCGHIVGGFCILFPNHKGAHEWGEDHSG